MIYWWLRSSPTWNDSWVRASTGDSQVYLTARTACAAVAAFFLALILGPWAIAWLKARFRERIDSASSRLNELHAAKNATPTMGGIFVVAAILLSAILFADLTSPYVQQGIVVVATFGVLGAIDDWVKARTRRRGLTARQKFVAQLLLGAGIAAWLMLTQRHSPYAAAITFPLRNQIWAIGGWFLVWAAFVQVGASNGVNLTDGLDGLAAGCLIFCGSAMGVLSYLAGHHVLAEYLSVPYESGAGELCVLLGGLVGASLGFLWFNCYPAQVFMGDTGSLPTGALLGYCALAIHQELLLLIAGSVFVVETLSVMVQVAWFKRTGRRVLLCSPLHNHFLFAGQHEMKIVVRFWIAGALSAVFALACLKIH